MTNLKEFWDNFKKSVNLEKDLKDAIIIIGVIILVFVGIGYAIKWGWLG